MRCSKRPRVRQEAGMSQKVSTSVSIPQPSATKPMGTSNRRRLIPEAWIATISLSAESRPSPIRTPTRTAIGIVKASTGASEQMKRSATVRMPPEWRTTKSIKRTSCGTKKTNVKTARPSNECEATSRPIYLSSRRMFARGHSSMLTESSAGTPRFRKRKEIYEAFMQFQGPHR